MQILLSDAEHDTDSMTEEYLTKQALEKREQMEADKKGDGKDEVEPEPLPDDATDESSTEEPEDTGRRVVKPSMKCLESAAIPTTDTDEYEYIMNVL